MKVLFFGTPQIAVPFLDWLVGNHNVVGVVTKKDEPVGRKYKITPPPVKVLAQEKKIEVFQPEGTWDTSKINELVETGADVGIAVAYGRLLPRAVFSAPKLGTFNIHFSLLPKYRGAAPLQWSLIHGETVTGVTAFWIQEGMDDGPICHQESMQVDSQDNAATLREKLVPLGIKLTDKVLKDLGAGKIIKNPQEGVPTRAPMLKKEDGEINWSQPAAKIHNLIRGVYEWPGARANTNENKKIKIFSSQVENQEKKGTPGEIIEFKKNEGFVVQCGEGQLLITEVQPAGKKKMPSTAFWQGAH